MEIQFKEDGKEIIKTEAAINTENKFLYAANNDVVIKIYLDNNQKFIVIEKDNIKQK